MKKRIFELDNAGGRMTIDLEVKPDGGLQVFQYDIGTDAQTAYGDSDVEYWTDIPQGQLGQLALHLLADRFEGGAHAVTEIMAYCAEHGIEHHPGSWH